MNYLESCGPYEMPELLHETLLAYKFRGQPTGGFLQSAIQNNFVETIGRADLDSLAVIREIARWIYWELPTASRGKKNYKNWIESGGLEGRREGR